MDNTQFGQPFGGIIQVAYVVEDLHESMKNYSEKFNIGPWFYSDAYAFKEGMYRGQPTDMTMALAIGFSGHMCFELIQSIDAHPSVYRDVVSKRGYGFHHLGMATKNYDADVEKYLKMGYELAFSGKSPRGIRFGYFDTTGEFPGMLELIEFNDSQEKFLSIMHQASLNWDGKNPVRKLESVMSLLNS